MTAITLTMATVQFDNAAELYVRDLLTTYAAGLTVAEIARRIRLAAAGDKWTQDAAHRALDALIRSGTAEHVKVGPTRIVRLVVEVKA